MTGLAGAQPRDGHVVIAGAIADAMAGAVEGEKRHQQNVGLDLGRLGRRLADAPLAALERLAEFPGAHDERLAAAGDDRQREPRPLPGELLHQRQRIDLALERP